MNKCFTAIRELNIEELEDYLKTGNINVRDDSGKTLLIYSIASLYVTSYRLTIYVKNPVIQLRHNRISTIYSII